MNEYIRKLMEVLGISEAEATEKLKAIAAAHPDEAERITEIQALIESYATPAIAALPNTVAGLVKDIASGQTGVDPDAWASSG